MTEIPTESAEPMEPEPVVRPEVPSPADMGAALEQAVQEYQPPPQEPILRPKPTLTVEQDRFIAQALYRADVDPYTFRVNHDPRKFLRRDGTLDEEKLAAAIVATANQTNIEGQ